MPKKPRKPNQAVKVQLDEKDIELVLKAAETNLRLYGDVYPSREAQQLARIEVGVKKCARCGETKSILEHFGMAKRKRRNGTTYLAPQGWCTACRGTKDAHPGLYS